MSGRTAGEAPAARRGTAIAALAAVLAVWAWASLPVLGLGFVGDDYQWWQHAREALARPSLLLAPYGGYRPVTTWLLAADYLLHGTSPAGYHATNLALQLAAGLALWAFLARLGCQPAIRAAAVLIWMTSPYAAEPAWTVSQRFEPVLLACWLGLAALWPRPSERWSRGRIAGAVGLALLTVFTKETWIVLPGFVLIFDLVIRRGRWRAAVARAGLAAAAVAVYLGLYFAAPPIAPGSFFASGLAGAYKIPHAWAVFTGLTSLYPLGIRFGPAEVAAAVMILACCVLAWRWRSVPMVVGLALYLLPFLPILPVGWLTSRYTTIPLAGFVTVVAGIAQRLAATLSRPAMRWAAVGAGALLAAIVAANLLTLRGDLADARAYRDLHVRLLAQARAFAPELPTDRPLVAVRLELGNPLEELSRSTAGIPKTYFVRAADPASLVDWSALWSYVLDRRGGPLFEDVAAGAADTDRYAVVGYREDGFVGLEARESSVGGELSAWRQAGFPVKLIRPWRP